MPDRSTQDPLTHATHWARHSDGHYKHAIGAEWFQGRGVYGGAVAASMLASMIREVNDPNYLPRSLTAHFCAPMTVEPAELFVRIERAGSRVIHLAARILQNDLCVASSLASFARTRSKTYTYCEETMPDAPPLSSTQPLSVPPSGFPAFGRLFDYRFCSGHLPLSGAPTSHSGGWCRLREPVLLDFVQAAALLDIWPPSIYTRLTAPRPAATVDLTYQFLAPLPLPEATPRDYYFMDNRSSVALDGYLEEHSTLWSPSGTLLARVRQWIAVIA